MTGIPHRASALRVLTPVLLLLVTAIVPTGVAGQVTDTTQVRFFDLEADSGAVRTVGGRQVYELLRPRLRDGETTVQSERMIQPAERLYLFTDNVVIVDGADTLTADRVQYDRNVRVGRASGNVRLGNGEVVVLAPEGDYDTRAKRADFRSGVTLVDSASTLSSPTGS